MAWRPVKNIVHAVCTHHFGANDQDDLTLEIGDDVYITEIGGPTQEWCRGWLLAQPSLLHALTLEKGQALKARASSGVFPRTHVEIREVLGGQETRLQEAYVNGDAVATPTRRAKVRPDPGEQDFTRSASVSRSRSIRRTRLVHRSFGDVQLEAVDVMPRSADARKEKAPLPALRIGDATDFSVEEPLVDEISSCLKEWYSTKLHGLVLEHDYDLLDRVSDLATRLNSARKQLIHDLLTEKELSELRERTVWDLVDGNKMMDGGVIVRSPQEKGRILTAQDSMPDMLKLQAMMSLRSRPPPVQAYESHISHMLAEIKHFPDMQGEPGVLHLYLCRQVGDEKPRPVSEVFAVEVPIEAQGIGIPTPAQLPRTLFTDLTKADIGSASDPSIRLYLVCLLQREEPIRTDSRFEVATPTPSTQNERLDIATPNDNGRRSFFFGGQRSRRASQDQLRPPTGQSAFSSLPKSRSQTPSSMDTQTRPSTATKRARRTIGHSVLEIGALLRQQESTEVLLNLWASDRNFDEGTSDPKPGEEGWDNVIKDLVRSPIGHFTKADTIGPFRLYLRAFAQSDAQSLIRSHPALLRDTHCTQSLSFVSTPSQPRSDIYLTLREPLLPYGARCFHPQTGSVPIAADTSLRNLQVTLEVRTDSGRRIENAIYPTSNRPPHTAFRTPAIDKGEMWNQTIRLSIPTQDMRNAHVILSIADGVNFPFALAWLPLWSTVTDSCIHGNQVLALWDYSEYTASTVKGKGAYQSLPAHTENIAIPDKSMMASLATHVTVTSSVNAQEPIIVALLHWDGTSLEGLMEVLEGFKLVHDTEIVRFFKPILAALDRIFDAVYGLTDGAGNVIGEVYAERAFSCLIHVLHFTSDRRFPGTKDILQEYVTEREPLRNSLKSVTRAFRAFLARPYEIEQARELRRALKVSGQIIKYITNHHDDGPRIVGIPLTPVQSAVLNLMRNPRKELHPTQVILMQKLGSWLPELLPVATPDEILEFVDEMMTASAMKKDSLRIHRLILVKELSLLEMFKAQEMRPKVLLKTSEWLEPYWVVSDPITDHQIDGIRLCCSILASQYADAGPLSLHYVVKLFETYHLLSGPLQKADENRSLSKPKSKQTFTPLFPDTYPFNPLEVDVPPPEAVLLEIATLLTALFQTGPPLGNIRDYVMGQDNDDALEAFIQRTLQVLHSIHAGRSFPVQWLSLYISHAKMAVTMLQWLFDVMKANLLPAADTAGEADVMSFNYDLWQCWFNTLIELSLDKTVSMENFSEQTSKAIWAIAGDIRETAALLLRYSWEDIGWDADPEFERVIFPMRKMGGFQVGLTAKMLPSVVRLCMGLHAALRSVGLDMLRSMIISEWQLSENLDMVQGAFFDVFDQIAQRDIPLGKVYTADFLHQVRGYFKILDDTAEQPLYIAVSRMLGEVEKLLAVLGELRTAQDPGSQLIQLYYLTDFLSSSGKDEAYIRRLHEISHFHTLTRCYASAACAVQMHIDALEQNDTYGRQTLPQLVLPGIDYPEEPLQSRKTRLYNQMITYYEKGYCWDSVLDVLQRLSDAYKAVWDVAGLADVAGRQSKAYRTLGKGAPFSPRYFYVSFNDHASFPPLLRGKQHIFEGPADCDRKTFCQTLHVQFPLATNLSPEYSHPSSQTGEPAIKVIPVTVYKDHLHPISRQSGVSSQYREHCLTAKPRVFAITDRQNIPTVSITDQLVEKKIFTTADALPTLLSYSRIISEKRLTLSPLQAAIDRTQRKTQILSVATERVSNKGASEVDNLVDIIRSSVNPDVTGSVAGYHRLLAVPPPDSTMSDGITLDGRTTPHSPTSTITNGDMMSEDTLLRRALSVALEDHARALETAISSPWIHIRASTAKSQLQTFFASAFALELITMYPKADWTNKSPAWLDPTPEQEAAAMAAVPGAGASSANGVRYNGEGGRGTDSRLNTAGGDSVAIDDSEHMDANGGGAVARKPSTRSRRMSLKKRLSFLSLGGRSASVA
ncbi:hypothetical protein AAFC00_002017 [Neodothiora populina]|uniref:Dedicator of cytokinesis protein 1 n=1 Tax=Neodothiora populina TaxID=2781224 RepID=A0ABR3PG03_9PEZI